MPPACRNRDDRRPEPLTKADFEFSGRIALENEYLGGGWHINRGLNPNNIPYLTPRDKMLAKELASVAQLPSLTQEVDQVIPNTEHSRAA